MFFVWAMHLHCRNCKASRLRDKSSFMKTLHFCFLSAAFVRCIFLFSPKWLLPDASHNTSPERLEIPLKLFGLFFYEHMPKAKQVDVTPNTQSFTFGPVRWTVWRQMRILATVSRETNLCGQQLEQKLYLLPHWTYGMKLICVIHVCVFVHTCVTIGYVSKQKVVVKC